MKRILLGAIFLLVGTCVAAQNLVPNPSFELVSGSPVGEGDWSKLQDWDGLNGTPDLYERGFATGSVNTCDWVGIPANGTGDCDEENGFNHYVGLSFQIPNGNREYLCAKLKAPLLPNENYRVEMVVQLADSAQYAINLLGALVSQQKPTQTTPGAPINLFATVKEFNTVTDRNFWIPITGNFQAQGGEEYITIGLFRTSASAPAFSFTNTGARNSGCQAVETCAYYFFDDIVVRPLNVRVNIDGDTIICPGESTILTADCNLPYWWTITGNPTDTFSINKDVVVPPGGPYTYYLHAEGIKDSVTIQILPPPPVNLVSDTLICEGDSIQLDATTPGGIDYVWSTGSLTPVAVLSDTGDYVVTVTNSACSATDTVRVPAFKSNPPVPLGDDSLYCFFYYDTLRLDAGPGLIWQWSTGSATRRITILQPGTYSVTVNRTNGCVRRAEMFVDESCDPAIFVPNAFTPDDDGINDVFKPFINNVLQYNFRVYNRRGQEIFYSEDTENGWDGTYKGEQSPIGVYGYRINFTGLDSEGIKVKKKILGTITLLR